MAEHFATRHRQPRRKAAGGFTLLEVLVVITILALLLSILAGAISSARRRTQSFACRINMREVSLEFRLFADQFTHPWRGDSEQYRGGAFSLWDFQQYLYRVDEFWDYESGTHEISFATGEYEHNHPMVCPSGPAGLLRDRGTGVESRPTPSDRISYAMNRRLFKAPACLGGTAWQTEVQLRERVLDHPNVALVFDVDAAAMNRSEAGFFDDTPFFAAPPDPPGTCSVYAAYDFWFPALRHDGQLSVGFVDGRVESAAKPLRQPGWDWFHVPTP